MESLLKYFWLICGFVSEILTRKREGLFIDDYKCLVMISYMTGSNIDEGFRHYDKGLLHYVMVYYVMVNVL